MKDVTWLYPERYDTFVSLSYNERMPMAILFLRKGNDHYHTWGGRLTKNNIAGIRPQGKESIKLEILLRPAGNNDSGYDIHCVTSKP